jgi:hypothetical protein
VKVAVLNLKGFLKELQGRPQFLGSPEDARKVVVGDSAVPIAFFRIRFCLLQQLQSDSVVLFKKVISISANLPFCRNDIERILQTIAASPDVRWVSSFFSP